MIELALDYISRGWPVFPLHGKKPLQGRHSFLDATLDVNRAECSRASKGWATHEDRQLPANTPMQ
jgi:Bifunctional DNA primase/polymerase, N-terminal